MNDHTHDYQAPTRRQIIDEAMRLAEGIDWGPFSADMPADEVQAIARTPEGLEALERHHSESDVAVDHLGMLTRWDAALLRSLLPECREDDESEPEWEHVLRLTWITAAKKAKPLEETTRRPR